MHILFRRAILAAAASLSLTAAPAYAAIEIFTATLTAAAETPPTISTGTGTVYATYDTATNMLRWTVIYEGLTGDAKAAHFHGPAAVRAKASPVVPVTGSLTSPFQGTATLTAAQAADLEKAMWYFNIQTAKYPDGEVRGQVVKQ